LAPPALDPEVGGFDDGAADDESGLLPVTFGNRTKQFLVTAAAAAAGFDVPELIDATSEDRANWCLLVAWCRWWWR